MTDIDIDAAAGAEKPLLTTVALVVGTLLLLKFGFAFAVLLARAYWTQLGR